jgi:hypothetical protein
MIPLAADIPSIISLIESRESPRRFFFFFLPPASPLRLPLTCAGLMCMSYSAEIIVSLVIAFTLCIEFGILIVFAVRVCRCYLRSKLGIYGELSALLLIMLLLVVSFTYDLSIRLPSKDTLERRLFCLY